MSDEPGPSSSTILDHDSELSSISSRHRRSQRRVKLTTNVQFDATRDSFEDIRHLLELFYEYAIPGPLLVRTRTDFSLLIGSGGQGQVRAASPEYISALQSLDPVGQQDGSVWCSDAAQQQCISFWQTCVIKTLRSKKGKLEIEAQSAVREVFSLCQASKSVRASQYIVRLLGWGLCLDALESGDLARSSLPFLVLERATCDMEQFVIEKKHEAVAKPSQMRMALDIGLGLQAIHAANMTHGDLKPSNVLIFPSDKHGWLVKLCDFGSASDGIRYKLKGHYAGTDTWRPPETFSNSESVDLQACDIFAYGLVVWAWLTGRGASPIESLDGSQILVDLGQQQFYRRALFDIVKHFGEPSDQAWLENESIFCPHFHDTEREGSRPKRSPFFCGFCFTLELEEGCDGLTRDFESPTINRVLNALSIALDELPSRRKRQPWDFLEPAVLAKTPQPPQPVLRHRAKDSSNDGTGTSTHSTGYGIGRLFQRPVSTSVRPGLKGLLNWGLFQLEHWTFVLAGCESFNTFRQFHRVFNIVLGPDSNIIDCIRHANHGNCTRLSQRDINSLKMLINRSYYGRFAERLLFAMEFAFWKPTLLPDTKCWSEDAIYALSRIRSRFVDDVCWHTLFALDTDLGDTIDQALAHVRESSCKMTLAWTLRNISALDTPEELHTRYFAFLYHTGLSDKDRTFRMHLLLERGFFLGQPMDNNNTRQTVFWRYLAALRDPKYAVQICQHFRRVASLDGVTDSARFYYTGVADTSGSQTEGEYLTTCLHDAVRALNPFVTEFLLKTDFKTGATDEDNRIANDILDDAQALMEDQGIPFTNYRHRKSEIALMFSKLTASKVRSSDLSLGWELWPAGSSQAFVETSTDLEIDAKAPEGNVSAYPYPITFQKPSTGLYQANAIALVERHISDTEREPYIFNPQRFLRWQGQIDTGQEPVKTPHFDESWYQAEALAQHRFSDNILPGDAHNFHEFWSNVIPALKQRMRRTIAQFSRWSYVKSFTKFLLSGDLVILLLTPLSLMARYCGWSAEAQLFLSMFALMGVYARLWHILDSMEIFSQFAFARPWLRTGDAKVDQVYNCGTMLFDFVLAVLLAFRAHFSNACAFIVGNILLQNLLVLGLATMPAGRFSFRFELNAHVGRPTRHLTAFPIFVATIVYTLKTTALTHDASRLDPALFVSRVAAIIAILLSIGFHSYRQPGRPRPVFADGKEMIVEPVTQLGGRTFGQTPDSLYRTAISFIIVVVLCVVVGDNIAMSVSNLPRSDVAARHPLAPECATIILIPLISKSLIIFKLIALGHVDQVQSVIMRTVGLSLDHGLVVFPLLVITSWCFGSQGEYLISAGQICFLFIQWSLLSLTVYQGASDWHWFKAVPLVGLYIIFVLFTFVAPLQ